MKYQADNDQLVQVMFSRVCENLFLMSLTFGKLATNNKTLCIRLQIWCESYFISVKFIPIIYAYISPLRIRSNYVLKCSDKLSLLQ